MNSLHIFSPGAQDNRFCAECGNTQIIHPTIGNVSNSSMTGKKNDAGKPRMDLLPMDALLEIAKVLTFGAEKYGDRNWEKGIALDRLRAAQMRHDAANVMGELWDTESSLPHIAHKACNALMELSLFLRGQKKLANE